MHYGFDAKNVEIDTQKTDARQFDDLSPIHTRPSRTGPTNLSFKECFVGRAGVTGTYYPQDIITPPHTHTHPR